MYNNDEQTNEKEVMELLSELEFLLRKGKLSYFWEGTYFSDVAGNRVALASILSTFLTMKIRNHNFLINEEGLLHITHYKNDANFLKAMEMIKTLISQYFTYIRKEYGSVNLSHFLIELDEDLEFSKEGISYAHGAYLTSYDIVAESKMSLTDSLEKGPVRKRTDGRVG